MQRKIKYLVLLTMLIILCLGISAMVFADTVKTGEVSGNSVNVRSSPNASSRENLLTSYDYGKGVTILGTSGSYYKIQYNDSYAYIHTSYVNNIKEEEIYESAQRQNGITGIVTGNRVNVREKANTSNYTKVIVKLNEGDEVDIIDQETSGWYGINYEGKKLWISSDFVSIQVTDEKDSNDYGLYEDGQNAIVTSTTLNLREQPDPNKDNVIVKLNKGMKVELLEAKDNWYKVNYGEHEGWVFGDYLYVEKSYIYADGKIGDSYTDVNFREQPNTKANIIEKLEGGRELTVIGGYDKWCKVIVDKEVGWVYAKYVAIKEASVLTSAYIIADRVNFRESTTTASKVIRMLNEDTKVWILDQENEWYKVNIDNEIGFVHSLYVQLDGVDVTAGRISGDDVKLREGPDTKYSIIEAYDRDKALLVYKRQEDWYKVKTSDGNVGWVFHKYVDMDNESASRSLAVLFLDDEAFISDVGNIGQKMAQYVRNFIGVPYVWGGTRPSGFDCSGLMKYVLNHYGISIMRVAADQARNGIPVGRYSLKPGDLVFFGTNSHSPNYVSHVGMYIGDSKFIHASSARNVNRVTISSLNSSYYSRVYLGARRYGNY